MTAVEWFFNELQRMQYFIGNDMLEAYKEAKEMEKQQIIDAVEDGNYGNGNEYYNETYGSNGSDVAKRLIKEMPKHIADKADEYAEKLVKGSDEIKTNNMKTGTSSLMDSHLVDFSNKNAHLIKSNSTTSSQTEISDEEMTIGRFMNWFLKHYSTATIDGFFGYVNAMGQEVRIQDILKEYRKFNGIENN